MTANASNDILRDLKRPIDSELELGEHALWMAQPDPRRLARQAIPAVIIGVFFGGFPAFGIVTAVSDIGNYATDFPGRYAFFPIFAMPFFLIGLAMTLSPLILYNFSKRTVYALTERRAIIVAGGFKTTVQSLYRADLETFQRKDHENGTGDIVFPRRCNAASDRTAAGTLVGFFGIPDVQEAEALIRNIINERK